MHVLIVINSLLPAVRYGGTERVAYSLGHLLTQMGHCVTFCARPGSSAPFAPVIPLPSTPQSAIEVPDDVDIIHFNNAVLPTSVAKPHIVTIHGNGIPADKIDPNSVFVSADHAHRHGCTAWVHNGLDWEMYPTPELIHRRKGFHFLGNGAWRVKNLRGAIATTLQARSTLEVMGANRLNFKMGFRFTISPKIHFHGMVDNQAKARIIEHSHGLIFPVTWHEPFGLAVIESLYYGAPVFATPYGALPELVNEQVGVLSNESSLLVDAMLHSHFDPNVCHQYAADRFNARIMAQHYLNIYERVLNGDTLNPTHPVASTTANVRNLPYIIKINTSL